MYIHNLYIMRRRYSITIKILTTLAIGAVILHKHMKYLFNKTNISVDGKTQ